MKQLANIDISFVFSSVNTQPANVFLDCDHNAKLGDIGLAAHDYMGSGMQGRAGEVAIGTWSYLAPEYKGSSGGRSSTKTDTYAFGLTLLQVICVRYLYQIMNIIVHLCEIINSTDMINYKSYSACEVLGHQTRVMIIYFIHLQLLYSIVLAVAYCSR